MTLPHLSIEPFPGTVEEWDRLIEGLPGSTFCHRMGWRSVLEDELGHETWFTVARDDAGRVRAALPLARVRSRIFGHFLVSMPFLSYGGPIGSPEGRRALAEHAMSRAVADGVDLLELRSREPLEGTGLATSHRKITVVKALPDTPEALWENGIKAKVRSQVRRPIKEGMTVRFGSECIEAFYAVFSATMRDLGTPVLPQRFFEAIGRHFPEASLFGVVEWEGRPVAAGCGFLGGGEFEITWAGASREHSKMAPNMLLYWGFMEECARRGVSAFNFGRCTVGSGTHRFKSQWGAEDVPLPWLQYSSSGVAATPNPDSPKFRAATRIWSSLPVAVTNLIGPPISRLLP